MNTLMSFFPPPPLCSDAHADESACLSATRTSASTKPTTAASSSDATYYATKSAAPPPLPPLTDETIYAYYANVVLPALVSSLPLLLQRVSSDALGSLGTGRRQLWAWWTTSSPGWRPTAIAASSEQQWQAALQQFWQQTSAHMPDHFPALPGEDHPLVVFLRQHQPPPVSSFWNWLAHEWPLMDWKVGVFVWRTFGSLLLVLAVLSIIPGRSHGWTAQLLRWPVLLVTYFLIAVELVVYVVLRLVIRLAEGLVARSKHRVLRRKMTTAPDYAAWYAAAAQLDRSQKRHVWLAQQQQHKEDDSGSHPLHPNHTNNHSPVHHDDDLYNWNFIRELMVDLKAARTSGQSLWALAVLENCTRKNVGGIMSEDLFSYANTGEPKHVVRSFLEEVTTTLHWLTDEAAALPRPAAAARRASALRYQQTVQTQIRQEKDKLWRSLVTKFDRGESREEEEEEEDDYIPPDEQALVPLDSRGAATASTQTATQTDSSLQTPPTKRLPSFHRDQVLALLKRARASYGRTALCLSGGAMMGLYHCGHVRALLETGCLPRIVSGTSAGSILGAILCTRTDDELVEVLRPEVIHKHTTCFDRPWWDRLKSVYKTGNMFDMNEWMEKIKWFANGNMTFAEAYERTGRVFCTLWLTLPSVLSILALQW